MTDEFGWTDRDGIVWRSTDNDVIVSSEYVITNEKYRVVVNDEFEGKNKLVLNCTDKDWLEVVTDAIKFAEGYTKGEYHNG